MSEGIVIPREAIEQIEFRALAFHYALIADLLEWNTLPKDRLITHLRDTSNRFAKLNGQE